MLIMKGGNGTKYSFLSNEHCGGNLFGFGKSNWRRPRGGMNPGKPPFHSFPSLQFKASKPNLGGSRNLSLRLLIVLLGAGV